MDNFRQIVDSPFGYWEVVSNGELLTNIKYLPEPQIDSNPNVITEIVAQQLKEYFLGERNAFECPLALHTGTEFQQKVWEKVLEVPYGRTTSYLDIANNMNNPGSVRAVGAANGQNPIPIIVPCHRVIGTDGSLTGYVYGKELKRQLLLHEGAITPNLFDSL